MNRDGMLGCLEYLCACVHLCTVNMSHVFIDIMKSVIGKFTGISIRDATGLREEDAPSPAEDDTLHTQPGTHESSQLWTCLSNEECDDRGGAYPVCLLSACMRTAAAAFRDDLIARMNSIGDVGKVDASQIRVMGPGCKTYTTVTQEGIQVKYDMCQDELRSMCTRSSAFYKGRTHTMEENRIGRVGGDTKIVVYLAVMEGTVDHKRVGCKHHRFDDGYEEVECHHYVGMTTRGVFTRWVLERKGNHLFSSNHCLDSDVVGVDGNGKKKKKTMLVDAFMRLHAGEYNLPVWIFILDEYKTDHECLQAEKHYIRAMGGMGPNGLNAKW